MARIRKSMMSAWGGHATELLTNIDSGEMVVHTRQNTEDIVDTVNIAKENLKGIGVGAAMSRGAALTPLAEIPVIDWNKACKLGHQNDSDYWKRWMGKPENQKFRIYEGTAL